MATSLSEFDAYWPSWPEDAQGTTLAEINLGCSFNHLVDLLWGGGSQFQVEVDQARGFIDYIATQWTENIEDLPSLPGGFDWSIDNVNEEQGNVGNSSMHKGPLDLTNKLRKVRFHNRGGAALLGQFFKNEELQRCREFDQNHKMIMEACVCTTAPYCDRFRVICRYSVETLHENACSLKIEFHIAYIKSVNSMTKVLMEKGAKGGLQKNFEIFAQTLGTFVPLLHPEDATDENEAGLSASPSSLSHTVQEMNVRCNHFGRWSSFFNWQSLTSPRFSDCIEPRVSNLSFLLQAKSVPPILQSPLTSKFIAHGIGILLFFLLVRFVLAVARGLWTLFYIEELKRTLLHPLLYFLDVPDSIGEVVTAVAVIEAAHWLLTAIGNFLVGSERGPVEDHRVLEGPQEFNHNVSQLVLSTRHSMPITSREQSQRDDTVTPVQISSPRSASSDREAKIGEQSLLLPPQLGSSSDVVDEPSFIDNTISFLKLGMVTAALGVELAISGMTKNRQADSEELMAEKESDVDHAAVDESSPGNILEEVFENERLQPFRGWGHTWPGHFLPTDKCRHWSVNHSDGKGPMTSMIFEEVEPQCTNGWTWGESEWQVDRTGEDIEAVDKDGWQYDFDFAWIKFPSEPGKGKKYIFSSLVRRRRWIRTRTQREGTSNSFQSNESGFVLPDMTQIVNRFSSMEAKHMAKSELSYFVEPAVPKLTGCSAPDDIEKSIGSAYGTLHRRHSSCVTMDRFFSIEENCFSFRTQLQGPTEDKLHVDPEQIPDTDQNREQPTMHETYPILGEKPSLITQSMSELRTAMARKIRNSAKAWSESGAIPSKFMRRSGSGRSQGSAPNIETVTACEAHFNEASTVCTGAQMRKHATRLDLAASDNDGQAHEVSSPQDSDDESLESNELNWTSMDGGKWVIECLSSKSSRSGSPGSPTNPPKGFDQ